MYSECYDRVKDHLKFFRGLRQYIKQNVSFMKLMTGTTFTVRHNYTAVY